MSLLGSNGVVTTLPNGGEKICVGCEYWTGARDVTSMGEGATSKNGESAFCILKKANTYPGQPCSCPTISFKKWSYLK